MSAASSPAAVDLAVDSLSVASPAPTPAPTNTETGTTVTAAPLPPSINEAAIAAGETYSYYSAVPPRLAAPSDASLGEECILGVDEAGRGPVLGPMVYGVFYLPTDLSDSLLRETHHFDDSKVLTAGVRANLMRTLADPTSDLHSTCGWAVTALSARAIASGMLQSVPYNLNAQAMDTTVALISGVLARGVNLVHIYVDTIGNPATYQAKLQALFPTVAITVAKKADSLYPVVSAASVCAKVTRDVALEVMYRPHATGAESRAKDGELIMDWGSGYPSDARCTSWLRDNMHPVFGWGSECRFSWGTAKDLIEGKTNPVKVEWSEEKDPAESRLTAFFKADTEQAKDELATWYGSSSGLAF
ncbi:Ribonuclease H2 subunit A [Ceratocystis fimbriata CBS 114723]|uniref:Ribonuclease n=1 Tax=Ceratocystis fimbriata CBS 114723 TaxID=1035309 RepID=A0A2C5WYP6_9PEZI|nr:Ribonuclease H2 subunit A [Ceratocystis fimbriata CBS 114723]